MGCCTYSCAGSGRSLLAGLRPVPRRNGAGNFWRRASRSQLVCIRDWRWFAAHARTHYSARSSGKRLHRRINGSHLLAVQSTWRGILDRPRLWDRHRLSIPYRLESQIPRTLAGPGEARAMKIGIVTDSTSDLPPYIIEQYELEVIPSILIIDGKEYADGTGISREEFY